MWWAVTTMTTVGYGDLYPHTDLGRGIAIVVMVVGIGFLSLLIGAVSERFLASELRQEAEQVERGVETDLESARVELLAELRSMSDRLREIEADVDRLLRA
jgi:voltage-gated potassium channel